MDNNQVIQIKSPPKPTVNLLYNGKDCTKDFSKYLRRLTFQDFEDEQSDELTITLNNNDGYFSDLWYPEKGDKLTCDIIFDGQTCNCGTFTVDENTINFSVSGDSVEIKALATSTNFSVRTKKFKNHTGKTLIQIANEVGKSYGFTVIGAGKAGLKLDQLASDSAQIEAGNIKVGTIIQKNESDMAFLKRIAKQYGYIFNIKDGYLTFIKLEEIENKEPIFTLSKNNFKDLSLTDSITKIYGKCKVQYFDKKSKSLKTYTAVGNTEVTDTLEIYDRCGSLSEAEKRAKAALKNGSKEVKGRCTLSLPVKFASDNENKINPIIGFIAGVNFRINGIGKFEGSYHIKSSTRTIDSSGLSIQGEIVKCQHRNLGG